MASEIPILHRERGFVVIDKPAGVPVEADSQESVVALLARQLAPPGGGRAWPRVVHRLDRETSGCLVVALNDAAAEALGEAFQAGEVKKEYAALVAGEPPEEEALDTPYGPDPRDQRRHTTQLTTPRRARLRFAVTERLRGAALLRIWLETGRTHQIRVQLAEAGYPVLGDSVYGAGVGGAASDASARAGLGRHALHAARLSFPSPGERGRIDCAAPLPDDLAAALRALREPASAAAATARSGPAR